jgi:hypothetical protein
MKSGHRTGKSRINPRACQYCGRPHMVSDHIAEESPFCRICLPERIAAKEREIGPTYAVEIGDYLVVTPLRPGTSGSMQS